MNTRTFSALAALAAAVVVLASAPAAAQFEDRYDFPIAADSWFDFGTPGLPALPADFFGPGSDPFEEHVYASMVPKSEWDGGDFTPWTTSSDFALTPGDPVGAIEPIPIRFTDVQARGVVQVGYLGGAYSETWEVHVDLSVVPSPDGVQTQSKTHPNGGLYDMMIPLRPRFTFTRVGDGAEVVADTGLMGWAPLQMEAAGVPWVHEVHLVQGWLGPHDGFVPGIEETVPGDPASQCAVRFSASEPTAAAGFDLVPAGAVPLPDPFTSVPGDLPGGSRIVFGDDDNPQLPPDFFGPGSEPFVGEVVLRGRPLGPTPWGEFEDSDTLIRRFGDPYDRCEIPSYEVRSVDIEIAALSLESILPVEVYYPGDPEPELWSLFMDVSPLAAAEGEMLCIKTHDGGGTYTATFSFHPRYTFERIPDGLTVIHDAADVGGPALVFEGLDGCWVHTADPGLQLLATGDGFFVPGVEQMFPFDPLTQEERIFTCAEASGTSVLAWGPTRMDPTGVAIPPLPDLALRACPNPFNPRTTISFELPEARAVDLRIYDMAGRLVRTLLGGSEYPTGLHSVEWDGRSDWGRALPSGVYFYRLEAGAFAQARKVMMVK